MIEGAIISIIQRETQNRTLAINTGQNLFPTFFGQRLQASIYRYLKHLLSETIHPKVDHFSDNDAEGTKRQSDVNSNNQRLFVYPFIDKSEHPCKTPPAIVRTMVEIICICINLSFSSESSLLSFKYRTSHRHGTKMNIAISATVITSSTGTSCKPPSKKRKLCILNKQEVIIYTTSVNSLFIFFIPFPSPSRSFSGHPGS